MEFIKGGYDRVNDRNAFRCYLIVRCGTKSEEAIHWLMNKKPWSTRRLQVSQNNAWRAFKHCPRLKRTDNLVVYEYFVAPARHKFRRDAEHDLTEEIKDLRRQAVAA